jgi:hypothetical protein
VPLLEIPEVAVGGFLAFFEGSPPRTVVLAPNGEEGGAGVEAHGAEELGGSTRGIAQSSVLCSNLK